MLNPEFRKSVQFFSILSDCPVALDRVAILVDKSLVLASSESEANAIGLVKKTFWPTIVKWELIKGSRAHMFVARFISCLQTTRATVDKAWSLVEAVSSQESWIYCLV